MSVQNIKRKQGKISGKMEAYHHPKNPKNQPFDKKLRSKNR